MAGTKPVHWSEGLHNRYLRSTRVCPPHPGRACDESIYRVSKELAQERTGVSSLAFLVDTHTHSGLRLALDKVRMLSQSVRLYHGAHRSRRTWASPVALRLPCSTHIARNAGFLALWSYSSVKIIWTMPRRSHLHAEIEQAHANINERRKHVSIEHKRLDVAKCRGGAAKADTDKT